MIVQEKIVIAGEGLSGLTIANLAVKSGFKVTLIRKRPTFDRNQIVFLNESSHLLLERIGVISELKLSQFDLTRIDRSEIKNNKFCLVKIRKLESALMKKLESRIKIIDGYFKAFKDDKLVVQTLTEELLLSYDKLIGADGAHSNVRSALGIPCINFGKMTLVGSTFLRGKEQTEFKVKEKITKNYFVKNISTPKGRFLLLHNKVNTEKKEANRVAIKEAAKANNWHEEATLIENGAGDHVEDIPVCLQRAVLFSDQKRRAILVGDGVVCGTFYIGTGANSAFKNAEIVEKFLQMEDEPNKYEWYDKQIQIHSGELIEANIPLFEPILNRSAISQPASHLEKTQQGKFESPIIDPSARPPADFRLERIEYAMPEPSSIEQVILYPADSRQNNPW